MSKEEADAKEAFQTGLVRLAKQVSDQKEGKGPDLSMIPPHLLNRRR